MNAIFKRTSIRKYTDKPIEPEKTELLLRAVMNVDESLEPFAIIAVGYPAVENKQQDRFDPARIHIVE